MDFELAKSYILARLEDELPKNLHYHGVHHTIDVYNAALILAEKENVQGQHLILLKTAALFHDAGFLVKYKDNENESVKLIRTILPKFNYKKEEIEIICDMVLSTKIPQNPSTLLDRILCDADLDYLGREDFFSTAHKLQRDWNEYGFETNLIEWYQQQLRFLEKHIYFTESARLLRKERKSYYISQVRGIVEAIDGCSKTFKFIDNLPVGLYRSTPEGMLIMVNKKFVSLFGFTSFDEVLNKNLNDLMVAKGYNRDRFKALLLEKGEVENLESTFAKKNGDVITFRETATLILDNNQQPLYFDGMILMV